MAVSKMLLKKALPNSVIIEAGNGLEAVELFRNEKPDIIEAVNEALKNDFRNGLSSQDSRYGSGNSAEKIYNVLKDTDFSKLTIKTFYEGDIDD